MNFKTANRSELLSRLQTLRGREIEAMIEILWCLHEIESRRLHLEMGYSSLYEFANLELGYDANESYLRIRASQVLALAPFIETELRRKNLSPTSLMLCQVAFNQENKRRQHIKLSALTQIEKTEVVRRVVGSVKNTKRILAECFPELKKELESTSPLEDGRTQISFAASEETMAKFGRLKELLANKNYAGKWEPFFDELAEIALEKLDPKRKAERAAKSKSRHRPESPPENGPEAGPHAPKPPPTSQRPSLSPKPSPQPAPQAPAAKGAPCSNRVTRAYISVHLQRKTHAKAQYRCQYVDPESGRRCLSTHDLQIDHILPIALGGTNEINNLRLLCGQHNRFVAWQRGLGPPGVADRPGTNRSKASL